MRHAGRIRPAKLFVQRVLKHTCRLILERERRHWVRASAEVRRGGFEVKRGVGGRINLLSPSLSSEAKERGIKTRAAFPRVALSDSLTRGYNQATP